MRTSCTCACFCALGFAFERVQVFVTRAHSVWARAHTPVMAPLCHPCPSRAPGMCPCLGLGRGWWACCKCATRRGVHPSPRLTRPSWRQSGQTHSSPLLLSSHAAPTLHANSHCVPTAPKPSIGQGVGVLVQQHDLGRERRGEGGKDTRNTSHRNPSPGVIPNPTQPLPVCGV